VRLVKVTTPEGKGEQVAQLAFEVGITQVSIQQQQVLSPNKPKQTKDTVNVETSTPTAKKFIDSLMSSSLYDPEQYSISVRQPRTVASREGPRKVTRPLVEPTVDVYEELWQFSHITFGFVGRVLISAMLLAYGMIEDKILVIVAGLLFLPLLPLMLAISFGLKTGEWSLLAQGAAAFLAAIALLVAGGAAVAAMMDPPILHNESTSLVTGFLISAVVGVAAGLASADDAGRREMIGLAATAQVAIIPVWFGISLIFGFPLYGEPPSKRAAAFLINVGTIVVASLVVYALLRMRGESVRRFAAESTDAGE
jgi:hypothetical protein